MSEPQKKKVNESYKNHCNCGGYAAGSMNNRDVEDPHMGWCAQYEEFHERKRKLKELENR